MLLTGLGLIRVVGEGVQTVNSFLTLSRKIIYWWIKDMEKIKRFFKDKKGVAAIHYGLIAALVDLAMIGAVYGLSFQDEYLFLLTLTILPSSKSICLMLIA